MKLNLMDYVRMILMYKMDYIDLIIIESELTINHAKYVMRQNDNILKQLYNR
jgi:hypothetical protein